MKFKNVSDKVKNFKIDNVWVSVQPGKEIELPGKLEDGLELVKESTEKEEVKEKPAEKVEAPREAEDGKDELDINNDGIVDKKDASLAGRVLARSSKKKRQSKKK